MSVASARDPEPARLIPARVRALTAYVPGEQPKVPGLVKLNTNENPYPPSPRVLAAIKEAVDQRLRLYPNPTAEPLRQRLGRLHQCRPEQIIVGNGSDELLALATRAFVEPAPGGTRGEAGPRRAAGGAARGDSRHTIQYFVPSYSLYPVLADIQGARRGPLRLRPDFGLPSLAELEEGGRWDRRAALTFVTTPNAPSGRGYARLELEAFCAAQAGVLVLDEAYVDFARGHALELALQYRHVLVARTFSKAYSLCFQRVGYFVGHPELIAALHKIRDSYNVNGLGQVAALATLDNLTYYRRNFRQIIATRQRVAEALQRAKFQVFPSQTNFLLVRPPGQPAREWLEQLRERRVLVRWFPAPEVRHFLRITIGTEAEMDALLEAVRNVRRLGGTV